MGATGSIILVAEPVDTVEAARTKPIHRAVKTRKMTHTNKWEVGSLAGDVDRQAVRPMCKWKVRAIVLMVVGVGYAIDNSSTYRLKIPSQEGPVAHLYVIESSWWGLEKSGFKLVRVKGEWHRLCDDGTIVPWPVGGPYDIMMQESDYRCPPGGGWPSWTGSVAGGCSLPGAPD